MTTHFIVSATWTACPPNTTEQCQQRTCCLYYLHMHLYTLLYITIRMHANLLSFHPSFCRKISKSFLLVYSRWPACSDWPLQWLTGKRCKPQLHSCLSLERNELPPSAGEQDCSNARTTHKLNRARIPRLLWLNYLSQKKKRGGGHRFNIWERWQKTPLSLSHNHKYVHSP